ncbi:MAG: SDR family NAD(P)-dependent oxidoreductase, partial [Schleiferiaceae bacterium]
MKNIWITGGSRGIGLETVKAFLADNFTVVVLTRNCDALSGLQ